MPRQLRLQYEGALYHLLSRGDRREDIYRDAAAGWRFGAEDFLGRLLDRVEVKTGERHLAVERSETEEEKAQRIVHAALTRRGWGEGELRERRKSDPGKVAIARQLRGETAVSLKWIAARLKMGSWTHVSNLLRAKSVKSED